VVVHDVTERKRAEERLRDSERRLRLLAEAIPQHVWSCLPDGRIDYCNQRWMDYTGLIPIVFISGHGDVAMSVQAMKAGAVEFLTKPFRDQDLLDAIEEAIERDRVARRQRAEVIALRERYARLTRRERDVMAPVVAGRLNKQIAATLGISEETVKVHRYHVIHKMREGSLADLIRMAEKLNLPPAL
jgi:FixJ family two-component response regulator